MNNKNNPVDSSGKIVVLTTNNEIDIVDYDLNNLEKLQHQVQGLIETIPMKNDNLSKHGIMMIGNEEAHLLNLDTNYGASLLYYLKEMGPVAGNVVFTGDDGEDLTPLSNQQLELLKSFLPEIVALAEMLEVATMNHLSAELNPQ